MWKYKSEIPDIGVPLFFYAGNITKWSTINDFKASEDVRKKIDVMYDWLCDRVEETRNKFQIYDLNETFEEIMRETDIGINKALKESDRAFNIIKYVSKKENEKWKF